MILSIRIISGPTLLPNRSFTSTDEVPGCALNNSPMGILIKVAEDKATSRRHVFPCGEAARALNNVSLTVADGAVSRPVLHYFDVFDKTGEVVFLMEQPHSTTPSQAPCQVLKRHVHHHSQQRQHDGAL